MAALSRDSLTNAYDRAAFAVVLRRLCQHVPPSRFGLLVLDLDHFKSINDAFGHLRGDAALCELVARIRPLLGPGQHVFRYSGDEFVVLLPQASRVATAQFAKNLLQTIRATPFAGQPPLDLSITIGCSVFPEDGHNETEIFARADARLLAAKRAGRGRIFDSDPLPSHVVGQTPSRLLERDYAVDQIHQFFAALGRHRRGQLHIFGPEGSGRTTLLQTTTQVAKQRGLSVVALACTIGLQRRVFGCFADAALKDQRLPSQPNAENLRTALLQLPSIEQTNGLVLAVDDLVLCDRASFAFFDQLLSDPAFGTIAVVTTVANAPPLGGSHLNLPLRSTIELAPFSAKAIQLWLRWALQAEPDDAMREWLGQASAGIPRRLCEIVDQLLRRDMLFSDNGVCRLRHAAELLELELRDDLPANQHNLPALPDLIGRDQDIALVKRDISHHHVITLVGAGGIGKTRLALQVAAEMLPAFRHGIWFVPLAQATTAHHAERTIAATLGLQLNGSQSPIEQLEAALRPRTMLLVLDNCEQLVDLGAVIGRLLRAAPHIYFLVTSRERLGLADECVYQVTGLPLQHADGTAASSVQLFVAAAKRASDDFQPSSEDFDHIARICTALDGMPLGIELAAAWTSLFSCATIAEHVGQNALEALTPGESRQRAAFNYFWQQLSPSEQQSVGLLSIFQGGFDRTAAGAVAHASPFLLAGLVDKAFLNRSPGGRYTLHPLLQQYAAEQVVQSAEFAPARFAHAMWYIQLAEHAQAHMFGETQVEWFDRLDGEIENLRAVLAWALARDASRATTACHIALGARLVIALGQFWLVRGYTLEGRQWIGLLLESVPLSPEAAKHARRWDAVLAQDQGDYPAAKAAFTAMLAEETADVEQAAVALTYLGWIASVQGDYDQARAQLERGATLARSAGNNRTLVTTLNHLGNVYYRLGDLANGLTTYQEAIALGQALRDRHEITDSLLGLGNLAAARQDFSQALAYYTDCMAYARAMHDVRRLGEVTGNIGIIAQRQGNLVQALASAQECHSIFRSIGDQLDMILAQLFLGEIRLALGAETAQATFLDTLQQALALDLLPTACAALVGLGHIAANNGDWHAAAQLFRVVAGHPASEHESRTNAESWLQEHHGKYPAQPISAHGLEHIAQRLIQGDI